MLGYLYLQIIEKIPFLPVNDSLNLRFLYAPAISTLVIWFPWDWVNTNTWYFHRTCSLKFRHSQGTANGKDLHSLSCFGFSFLKDEICLYSKPPENSPLQNLAFLPIQKTYPIWDSRSMSLSVSSAKIIWIIIIQIAWFETTDIWPAVQNRWIWTSRDGIQENTFYKFLMLLLMPWKLENCCSRFLWSCY